MSCILKFAISPILAPVSHTKLMIDLSRAELVESINFFASSGVIRSVGSL